MKLKIIRKQPICVSKLTVCENLAETVGFEPTDPKDQRISSAPRYDRFDTSPYFDPRKRLLEKCENWVRELREKVPWWKVSKPYVARVCGKSASKIVI